MAEPIILNQAFLDFLKETPEMLSYFVKVTKAFLDRQSSTVTLPPSTGAGPPVFEYDKPPVLTTVDLSNAEIDALANGYAEAIVKEKFIEFVKGFITGVMIAR